MSTAAVIGGRADLATVLRLREQIAGMQRRRAEPETLPVPDALSSLFPDGGLRPGAAYALQPGATSLLLALLGASSREGSWCAVIGLPELSMEAAEGHGVALDRLALIPDPGDRWLQAASAAAEVFPLVAVRPPRRPAEGEAARLEARLRDRGGTLLTLGEWPGIEAALSFGEVEWHGIGRGHGLLSGRAVTITLTGRRTPRPRSVRVLLPGPSGHVEAIPSETIANEAARRPLLRAVGT
ncbi:hypothetical protein [Microbacterium sp. Marseille-Q6965]|uniref:hypothetical protein n=1 Tax=Microbacterium sp. Marseille-Q6965 TaxID=2965072 RepID=UPI0021B7E8FC|nr:hypothetical protein [Microbacterium sp. Marseille-Q6965]